jgi:hypothetical protein
MRQTAANLRCARWRTSMAAITRQLGLHSQSYVKPRMQGLMRASQISLSPSREMAYQRRLSTCVAHCWS